MPVCCGCYAEHTISIAKHFKMRRASNNRQNVSRCSGRLLLWTSGGHELGGRAQTGQVSSSSAREHLRACVTIVMFLLLVASQTYGSSCISNLGVGVTAWESFGHVGKTEWCSLWTDNDPLEKPECHVYVWGAASASRSRIPRVVLQLARPCWI